MKRLVTALLVALLAAAVAVAQVIPPNANPRFTAGADVAVDEDSGMYSALWATQISDGEGAFGANSGTQSLTFVLVAQQPSLFSRLPSIDSAGFLHFTPAPNAFGSTTVSVYLQDDGTAQCIVGGNVASCPGGCSPVDCSRSATVQFQINIRPLNDCPEFQIRGDVRVDEDSGQSRSVGFAHSVHQGAPNENTQQLTWIVTVVSGSTLFQQAPQMQWTIANPSSADLIFTPADNAFGQARICLNVEDDGASTGLNCNRAPTEQCFTITVTAINDRPTFTMGPSPVTVLEDATAAQSSFPNWATNMNPGAPNEASQALRFNLQLVDPTTSTLFTVQPSIDPVTGTLAFLAAPDANTFGRTVQAYVQLQDDGGGSPLDVSCHPITSCPRVQIIITPVNDAPRFIPGGNIEVFEDLMNEDIVPVPPIYVDGTAWARGISVGPDNEGLGIGREGQVPVFELTVDNIGIGLFDTPPSLDPFGTLSFRLKPNANGVATVTVTMRDTGVPAVTTPQVETFVINVLPVNDPPTFIIRHPNPIVINENVGPLTINSWAINVVAGPAEEMTTQRLGLDFFFEPLDTQFFAIQPTASISEGTATLQFQVAAHKWGQTTVRVVLRDTGGVANKGTDTSEQWLTFIVNSVNDPPTFNLVEPVVTVIENSQPLGHVRTGFVYNISSGPSESNPTSSVLQGQNVRFILTHNFNHLFSVPPAVDLSGRLTFTTANDEFGRATVTIYAEDNHMPPAVSASLTFDIDVLPRNNPPTFDLQGDVVGRMVTQCSSAGGCTKRFSRFATNIFVGPINERNTQSLTFSLSVQPQFDFLFATGGSPRINFQTGDLEFTLAEHRSTEVGNPVVVTVVCRDSGGVENGGVDTTVKSFKLEVQPLDNPPTFTPGADQRVSEDSPTTVVPGWATQIRRGPLDASTEGLRFEISVSDPTLFTMLPKIDLDISNTGTLSFTPAPDRYGTAYATITLVNLLTNKFSEQFTFLITIDAVNDAPTFTRGADVIVMESSGFQELQWARNLNPGPFEDRQLLTFTITCQSSAAPLFAIAPVMDSRGVMRFTLADGKFGLAPCTATLRDNGGSPPGLDSSSQTFSIRVQEKNDAPTFTKGRDITMFEDDKEQLIDNFVRDISAGVGDEDQQLTFILTPSNPNAFLVPPKIDSASGRLTFTLVKYFNGIVTVRYYLQDDGQVTEYNVGRSVTEEFRLVVRAVNDPPTFVVGSNIAVLENSGVHRFPRWARDIAAGPVNEQGQSLRFTLTAEGTGSQLFGLPPTVDPLTGDLQFSTAQDRSGVTSIEICLIDNGGTENGGVDRLCKSLSISIASVNKAPTAVFADTVSVLEDAGVTRIANFLRNVGPGGGADHATQLITSITCTVPSTQTSVFKTQPRIAIDTYELSFETAADYFGQVEITVTIMDNGGTTNGGVDTLTGKFKILVLPVNDAPTFTPGTALTMIEDAPPFSALWASRISAGPANENMQTVQFDVKVSRPDAFRVLPTINGAGFLEFTLANDVNGLVDLFITLQDNGGIENGGNDKSAESTMRLTVTPINDAPVFTPGPAITLLEDADPFTFRSWATAIAAGPLDETITQTLQFTLEPADPSFFAIPPAINIPSGDLTFTLAPNKFGVTTVAVKLTDSGPTGVNGHLNESPARTLTIRVTGVNDPPMFVTSGDVTVLEDAGDVTRKDWITAVNPGDFETDQAIYFSVTVSDIALFSSVPRVVGRDLLFTPAPDANGVVSLTLNATDRSGSANGGKEWHAETFRLTITAVNDPPVFTPGTDVTVAEGSLQTVVTDWLVSAVPGPADEARQLLTPVVTVDRVGVLSASPLVNVADRSLSFLPLPHAFGSVVVSVSFRDNGGVLNGGVDTSVVKTFRVIVTPVNDPPSFTPGPLVLMVTNTATSFSAQWATNISAGPNESGQAVAFVVVSSSATMFTVSGQPSISAAGVLSFSVSPGVTGNTTLSVTAKDAEGATSATHVITIVVGNAFSRDTISLVMNVPATSFNADTFRQVVATNLGITSSRVVIRNVQADAAGLRVDFQILAAENADATSDTLTRTFIERALQPDSSLRLQLNVISASVVSSGVGAPPPPGNTLFPGPASSGDDGSGVNWVALGVGLFVGITALIVIVLLIVAYRRHKSKRDAEREAKYGATSASVPDATPPRRIEVYESSPRSIRGDRLEAAQQANPIPHSFVAKSSPPRATASDNWAKVRRAGLTTPNRGPSFLNAPPTAQQQQPDYQNQW